MCLFDFNNTTIGTQPQTGVHVVTQKTTPQLGQLRTTWSTHTSNAALIFSMKALAPRKTSAIEHLSQTAQPQDPLHPNLSPKAPLHHLNKIQHKAQHQHLGHPNLSPKAPLHHLLLKNLPVLSSCGKLKIDVLVYRIGFLLLTRYTSWFQHLLGIQHLIFNIVQTPKTTPQIGRLIIIWSTHTSNAALITLVKSLVPKMTSAFPQIPLHKLLPLHQLVNPQYARLPNGILQPPMMKHAQTPLNTTLSGICQH
jgi:hypothetical protein